MKVHGTAKDRGRRRNRLRAEHKYNDMLMACLLRDVRTYVRSDTFIAVCNRLRDRLITVEMAHDLIDSFVDIASNTLPIQAARLLRSRTDAWFYAFASNIGLRDAAIITGKTYHACETAAYTLLVDYIHAACSPLCVTLRASDLHD